MKLTDLLAALLVLSLLGIPALHFSADLLAGYGAVVRRLAETNALMDGAIGKGEKYGEAAAEP